MNIDNKESISRISFDAIGELAKIFDDVELPTPGDYVTYIRNNHIKYPTLYSFFIQNNGTTGEVELNKAIGNYVLMHGGHFHDTPIHDYCGYQWSMSNKKSYSEEYGKIVKNIITKSFNDRNW